MTKRTTVVMAAAVLLLGCAAWMPGSTINGIANQVISALTAHGVVIGGGSGDLATANPSSTSGYALVSNGTSADPSFQAVPNAGLANSSITIATSGCITGGGAVSLGASISLACTPTGASFAGVTNATAGAAPTWVLASGDATWTLSANATAAVTVATGDKWVPHTIQVCQPASGGPYTLTWPANVHGGMVIGTTASKCSIQSFESYDGSNLYATGTGVLNQ